MVVNNDEVPHTDGDDKMYEIIWTWSLEFERDIIMQLVWHILIEEW